MTKLEDTAPDIHSHMKLIVIPTMRHTANLLLHCPKVHRTLPAVCPMNWDQGFSSVCCSSFSFQGLPATPVLAGDSSKMNYARSTHSTVNLLFLCKPACPVGKNRFPFTQQQSRWLTFPPETPLQCHKRHQDGCTTFSAGYGEDRFPGVPTGWEKHSEGLWVERTFQR